MFECKYTIADTDWFSLLRKTAMEDFLSLKKSSLSLTHRIFDLLHYSPDDETSQWNEKRKKKFGCTSVFRRCGRLGKLFHKKGTKRLPLFRNFKIEQIEDEKSKISGAVKGQYYLKKSDRWVEEWGNHTEPMVLTYYNMLELGNILFFEPGDVEVKNHLRLGAERLLDWQKEDGSWAMGY